LWWYSFELWKFAENILLAVITDTPMSFLQALDSICMIYGFTSAILAMFKSTRTPHYYEKWDSSSLNTT